MEHAASASYQLADWLGKPGCGSANDDTSQRDPVSLRDSKHSDSMHPPDCLAAVLRAAAHSHEQLQRLTLRKSPAD